MADWPTRRRLSSVRSLGRQPLSAVQWNQQNWTTSSSGRCCRLARVRTRRDRSASKSGLTRKLPPRRSTRFAAQERERSRWQMSSSALVITTSCWRAAWKSMTNAPYALEKARQGYRMGDGQLLDLMLHDGLTDAVMSCHMGVHGSTVAVQNECHRNDQDKYALRSHQLVSAAYDAGRMQDEIVPVELRDRKGNITLFERDESPRADTSLEALARLKPVFGAEGSVTAGNAPGINDGAAAVVIASEEYARDKGAQAAGDDHRPRHKRLGCAISRLCAGNGREERARQGWTDHRRHGCGRDQSFRQRHTHFIGTARHRPIRQGRPRTTSARAASTSG